MNPTTTPPDAPHLIGILTVRQLFEQRSGNSCADRATVSKWIKRRAIKSYGANPFQRLFDKATILAVLDADFPSVPQFISVEDAFHMACRPYPNQRGKQV